MWSEEGGERGEGKDQENEANLEFPEGRGDHYNRQIPSMGEVCMFSVTTDL